MSAYKLIAIANHSTELEAPEMAARLADAGGLGPLVKQAQ